MQKLDSETIQQRLGDHPEWTQSGESIQRTFSFNDFLGAMEFVNRVAEIAEQQQHHPDIMIRYNKVTLSVTTHDAGGLTEKDFQLARAADGAVARA